MARNIAHEFWVGFRGPFKLFVALVCAPIAIIRAFINHDLRSVQDLFTRPPGPES
jgi:hypothetical protein